MEKKSSDLEKMKIDRRKAEEEYVENQERMLEAERIRGEGIHDVGELVLYISDIIENVKHSEDLARMSSNSIVYSEAIGIHREMEKLLDLIFMGSTYEDRAENEGSEGYA